MYPDHFLSCRHLSRIFRVHSKVALFLDLDSVLPPERKPGEPGLQGIKEMLRPIAGSPRFHLSVVSGRPVPELRKNIGLSRICYAGNNGLDILSPSFRYTPPEAVAARPLFLTLKRLLTRQISGTEEAWIEDRKISLALHFRPAEKERVSFVKTAFLDVAAEFLKQQTLSLIKRKDIWELVPAVFWNKGRAALWILRQFKSGCLPVYVGDEQKDAGSFKVLAGKGITVRIGRSKQSSAGYYLTDRNEIPEFLKMIRSWTGSNKSSARVQQGNRAAVTSVQ